MARPIHSNQPEKIPPRADPVSRRLIENTEIVSTLAKNPFHDTESVKNYINANNPLRLKEKVGSKPILDNSRVVEIMKKLHLASSG
jgi:hypothetical protein